MRGLSKTLAIALESVGCTIIVVGIGIECIMHADIGYIVITAGASTIAVGSLIFVKLIRGK